MINLIFVLLISTSFTFSGYASESITYVPNKEVAIKIAEAVLENLYGKGIYRQKPYNIIERKEYWIIKGSLPKRKPRQVYLGG